MCVSLVCVLASWCLCALRFVLGSASPGGRRATLEHTRFPTAALGSAPGALSPTAQLNASRLHHHRLSASTSGEAVATFALSPTSSSPSSVASSFATSPRSRNSPSPTMGAGAGAGVGAASVLQQQQQQQHQYQQQQQQQPRRARRAARAGRGLAIDAEATASADAPLSYTPTSARVMLEKQR